MIFPRLRELAPASSPGIAKPFEGLCRMWRVMMYSLSARVLSLNSPVIIGIQHSTGKFQFSGM